MAEGADIMEGVVLLGQVDFIFIIDHILLFIGGPLVHKLTKYMTAYT